MAFVHADRVKESSTTTGTGTYSLGGPSVGFRSFVNGVGTTNRCTYCVTDGTDWEINEGTVTDATPDTLTRDRLLASSTGSAISWAAGTRTVMTCYSAADMNPRTTLLGSAHTLSSTTATEVTGLQFATVQPGTYIATYYLRCQSATTTVGVGLGINFTGTAANPKIALRHVTTGTTAATGVADDVANTLTGQTVEGRAANAYTTTAPNMLCTGFAATGSDALFVIEVSIVVTAAGDLELWHSSETATSTTVSASSCAKLERYG